MLKDRFRESYVGYPNAGEEGDVSPEQVENLGKTTTGDARVVGDGDRFAIVVPNVPDNLLLNPGGGEVERKLDCLLDPNCLGDLYRIPAGDSVIDLDSIVCAHSASTFAEL